MLRGKDEEIHRLSQEVMTANAQVRDAEDRIRDLESELQEVHSTKGIFLNIKIPFYRLRDPNA